MNIEQNSNMQELTEEEYTKVYGGESFLVMELGHYNILPVGPLKPKKPDIKVVV